MKIMDTNFLYNNELLKAIDNLPVKEQIVRISLLDWNENIIQEIQGKAIGGSLTIDGSAAMRRTCSITLVPDSSDLEDMTNISSILQIGKKIKLYIGIKNDLKNEFPEYLEEYFWFLQGIFIIDSFSLNQSVSDITIDLSLKDKMCLLNGECGGILPAAVDFDTREYLDTEKTNEVIVEKVPLIDIIQELVNHWGNEPLENIIINDIDLKVKYVVKWYGDSILYLCDEVLTTIPNEEEVKSIFNPGQDVGYWYKNFIYDKELSANAGDSIYSVLEKICNNLGNFEFFYNINGKFIFQEKKNYLNNTFIPNSEKNTMNNIEYCSGNLSQEKEIYNFEDLFLINSFSVTPQLENIKNDFIIWGERKSDSISIPIRYHLAIDQKPTIFTQFDVIFYDKYDPISQTTIQIPAAVTIENGSRYYMRDGVKTKVSTEEFCSITPTDWRTQLFLEGSVSEVLGIDSGYYYTELKNEWSKIYDIKQGTFKVDPTSMDYFLDFIDNPKLLKTIGVSAIGRRTFVQNDNTINCMFESEIPNLVIIQKSMEETEKEREELIQKGYQITQVNSDVFYGLALGGNLNSAYVALQDYLAQYTNLNESINLTCIPIYYLEPNRIIKIKNNLLGINGEYFINSISIPLKIEENMTISATKIMQKI